MKFFAIIMVFFAICNFESFGEQSRIHKVHRVNDNEVKNENYKSLTPLVQLITYNLSNYGLGSGKRKGKAMTRYDSYFHIKNLNS